MGQGYKRDWVLGWDVVRRFTEWVEFTCMEDYDVVVGILNGGALPALVVSNVLKLPVYWIRVRSYEGKEKGELEAKGLDFDKEDLGGKKILLVDDIVDTGDTLNYVRGLLLGEYGAKDVFCVTVVSKRKMLNGVNMLTVPQFVWVVFPWENRCI